MGRRGLAARPSQCRFPLSFRSADASGQCAPSEDSRGELGPARCLGDASRIAHRYRRRGQRRPFSIPRPDIVTLWRDAPPVKHVHWAAIVQSVGSLFAGVALLIAFLQLAEQRWQFRFQRLEQSISKARAGLSTAQRIVRSSGHLSEILAPEFLDPQEWVTVIDAFRDNGAHDAADAVNRGWLAAQEFIAAYHFERFQGSEAAASQPEGDDYYEAAKTNFLEAKHHRQRLQEPTLRALDEALAMVNAIVRPSGSRLRRRILGRA